MTSQLQTVKVQVIKELREKGFDLNSRRYLVDLTDPLILARLAIHLLEDVTANMVAEKIGISRAAASDYLNQVYNNPLVKVNDPVVKYRKGRVVHYRNKC